MKYALGVEGPIRNTLTGDPALAGLDSVPFRPSYGCPEGETFPLSVYRNPSMWSNDRFSSMRTTMCSIEGRPLPAGIADSVHAFGGWRRWCLRNGESAGRPASGYGTRTRPGA